VSLLFALVLNRSVETVVCAFLHFAEEMFMLSCRLRFYALLVNITNLILSFNYQSV